MHQGLHSSQQFASQYMHTRLCPSGPQLLPSSRRSQASAVLPTVTALCRKRWHHPLLLPPEAELLLLLPLPLPPAPAGCAGQQCTDSSTGSSRPISRCRNEVVETHTPSASSWPARDSRCGGGARLLRSRSCPRPHHTTTGDAAMREAEAGCLTFPSPPLTCTIRNSAGPSCPASGCTAASGSRACSNAPTSVARRRLVSGCRSSCKGRGQGQQGLRLQLRHNHPCARSPTPAAAPCACTCSIPARRLPARVRRPSPACLRRAVAGGIPGEGRDGAVGGQRGDRRQRHKQGDRQLGQHSRAWSWEGEERQGGDGPPAADSRRQVHR